MRILSRRFLASYLATLAACVGACLLALAIVDMLVDFDAVVEGGAAALGLLVARAPRRWLREVLPFASFAAAFLAVALPARRGEILALCAAGIHPARATLPILGAALAVGAASSALPGAEAVRARESLAAKGAASGSATWLFGGGRVIRVGQRDSRGGELRDVRLFETNPGFRLQRILYAAQARVAGERWMLRGARELRFEPALPAEAPRPVAAPTWVPSPGAAAAPASAARIASNPGACASAAAVLALLAVPLGLGVRSPHALASRALAALALAALFRGATQAVELAGERALAAAWLVQVAFAGAAALLWARAPR